MEGEGGCVVWRGRGAARRGAAWCGGGGRLRGGGGGLHGVEGEGGCVVWRGGLAVLLCGVLVYRLPHMYRLY